MPRACQRLDLKDKGGGGVGGRAAEYQGMQCASRQTTRHLVKMSELTKNSGSSALLVEADPNWRDWLRETDSQTRMRTSQPISFDAMGRCMLSPLYCTSLSWPSRRPCRERYSKHMRTCIHRLAFVRFHKHSLLLLAFAQEAEPLAKGCRGWLHIQMKMLWSGRSFWEQCCP